MLRSPRPVPARGSGRPTRALRPSVAARALPYALPVALWLACPFQALAEDAASGCAVGAPERGVLDSSRFSSRTAEDGALEADLLLEVLEAAEGVAVRYAPLAFWNGRQVEVAGGPVRLACGDSAAWTVRIEDPGPAGMLHVYPNPGSLVPDRIRGATPDRPLSPDDAAGAAYLFTDVRTEVVGSPKALPVTGRAPGYARPAWDGYLSLEPRSLMPAYIATLPAGGALEVRVVVSDGGPRPEPVALTCLLDERQVEAFERGAVWTGLLEPGRAVAPTATFDVRGDGWHRIRCLILNGLADPEGADLDLPRIVFSLFVLVGTEAGAEPVRRALP